MRVLVILSRKDSSDGLARLVPGKHVTGEPYVAGDKNAHALWLDAQPDVLAEISKALTNVDRPLTLTHHVMIPEDAVPAYLEYKRAFSAEIRTNFDIVNDYRPELAMLAFREEASSVDTAPEWMADHAIADYMRRGRTPQNAAFMIGQGWTLDDFTFRPVSADELVGTASTGTLRNPAQEDDSRHGEEPAEGSSPAAGM